MRNRIITAVAGAVALLSASQVFAVDQLIEGFENNLDPAGWQQVSPAPQNSNSTNATIPAYVATHVTEGAAAGSFIQTWVLPGVAASSNPYVPADGLTFWSMRNNIATPANFAVNTFPNTGSVVKADIFNTSLTDTVQVAFYVQDNAGSGALERGPFVSCPPNTSTAYQWTLGTDPTTAGLIAISGDGVLDGATSRIKGFFCYTNVVPTAAVTLEIDNIRVDAQLDITAPAIPAIRSVAQGPNPGELVVSWAGVADVDLAGYKVYVAQDANFGTPVGNRLSFPGTPTATIANPLATSTTLTGLTPDTNYYIRVTAYDNATPSFNESISDIVLGANLKTDGSTPEDLVVLDYDRYALTAPEITVDGYYHGIVYWAQALSANTRHFQSCRAAAVDSAAVALNPALGIVYWATERDGDLVADQTLSTASEAAISAFLTGGGDLLLTGTSIGEDLTTNGDAGDQTFYANVLKATLTNENVAQAGIDADLTNFPTVGAFATGTDVFNVAAGSYANNEALTATGSAVGALVYTGVAAGNAAILDSNALIYFGFAFETVRDTTASVSPTAAATSRAALIDDSIAYLEALPPSQAQNNWSMYE